jgi:hypothetical protein
MGVVRFDLGFDSLNNVQERNGIETIVRISAQRDRCPQCVAGFSGPVPSPFDFFVGRVAVIIPRRDTVREDTDVNGLSLIGVPRERSTNSEYLIVGMCGDTEYRHRGSISYNHIECID